MGTKWGGNPDHVATVTQLRPKLVTIHGADILKQVIDGLPALTWRDERQ